MSLRSYSFSKEERLKSKKEISRVFKDGIFLYEKHLSVVYVQSGFENSNTHKMGVSVPKKFFKRAVDRNLMKRRIRECFRLNKHVLYETDITLQNMMFVYRSKDLVEYGVILVEMQSLLKRMVLRRE